MCVRKHLPLGEKGSTSTDFFIGKIKCIQIDEEVYEDGKINYDALQAMSRLAGNDYAQVGPITTIQ